jgi:SpoVK/Ycf46/Vps4 family AAA+-type ATPase
MGGQEILVELLAGTIAASLAAVALHFSYKLLDPNRAAREAAAAKKKEIARRLGRPNIVTNQYEDIIACDVANPMEISTTFDSIGGLGETKRALQEIVILPLLRPELFAGGNLLRPVKGCMLYGPPGTGKTLLAKALAKECRACFINVRTSTLQSKWFGDANKLVAAVFSLAWKLQPSIIFIDEVDSFLGARKNSEHEANTSMKTEFMTMWDGFQTNEHARVMVLAATNRPWEVDDAILRRLPRSFEVGLPDYKQRVDILSVILRNEPLSPGFLGPAPDAPVFQIARATERYSGSDLKELCKQAAYGPIRDLLDAERAAAIARQRARLEKALKKQASKSGGTGTHPGVGSGVDDLDGDLDEFFDAEEERDESGARNDGKPRRKRAMTLADFSAVLSNSGTSADAAAKYRHADNERRFDRDARAAHSAYGGGGVSPSGSFLPGVSPEQMAALESVVTPEMVAQLLGAMAGKPDGAAPAPAPASPAEITPEMLAKMMEQFMLQRSAAVPGGGGASPGN